MARNSQTRTGQPRKSGGIWSGILIGLITGLAGAAILAIWVGRNNPFTERPSATASSSAPGTSADAATPDKNAPIVDPATRAAAIGSSQHYDFYHILPSNDASGSHSDVATTAPAKASAQVYLQAGSFPDPQQADDLKARLALMGYEATIQTIDLPDKGTWHRVRLGPYTPADAVAAQTALAQNHIDTTQVKPGSAANPTPTSTH